MKPFSSLPSLILGTSIFVLGSCTLIAAQAPPSDAQSFYREQVHPILRENCLKCHGGEKIKGGLGLTNREGLLKGGDTGDALHPTDPAKSNLLEMISYKDSDHEMPPDGKLADAKIDIIRQWLAMGAPYDPALEKAPLKTAHPTEKPKSFEELRDWWAYKPATPAPVVPGGETAALDALLAKKRKEAGIRANPRASKETLIRRAYYDLLGLPPSPEQVRAFVEDPSPEAWPKLIETLLAQPQYGEKWARHWMDIVRYAETEGFERDSEKPHIWRYRDYLIEAFNADMPYDRFITEQLAGDEVESPSLQSLTATGFLRLMQFDDEPADRLLAKYDVIADTVNVTAEAFLGMSMGCARCHDHKKDPITQKDYYSFMAFFHGVRDYRATRHSFTPFLPPEQKTQLERDRIEQLARLDSDYRALATPLSQWAASNPKLVPAPALVEAKSGRQNAWVHTTQSPDPAWKNENFDASSWSDHPKTQAREGSPVWMRGTFGLSAIPKTLYLDLEYAGATEVFVNGTPVLLAQTLPKGTRVLDFTREVRQLLHTGANLIAIRTNAPSEGELPRVSFHSEKPLLLLAESELERLEKGTLPNLDPDLPKKLEYRRKEWLQAAQTPAGIPLSAVEESGTTPPDLHVHKRGNPAALGARVDPAFPAVLSGTKDPKPATIEPVRNSSGRRLALARWITNPSNPLVSRVAANRIWQYHFGKPIAGQPNDFGRLGELPTNPELLDTLAALFVQNAWSFKTMHRILMNSEAYQMSSASSPEALAKDPENKTLWRFPMRRLTAEELRDSILAVSGILKLNTYGPPVFPPLPREVLETQSRPGSGWPKQSLEESARRSIYVRVKRSLTLPILASHDQAAPDSSCAVRFASTVPTQALGMLNSEFMEEQARLLAARLRRKAGDNADAQIERGLQLVLQRKPTAAEKTLCARTLENLSQLPGVNPRIALERFALLAINLNEFVYLD
jgi:hypothetical protein